MESPEVIKQKIDRLQSKFQKQNLSRYKLQTDEYEHCLQSEIQQKDTALSQSSKRFQQLQQDYKHLQLKYTRNQSQISQLQTHIDGLKSELYKFNSQKIELEHLNDQWEQTNRILQFSKQDLEQKLYQAEQNAIMFKQELDELNAQKQVQVQRLKDEQKQLKQEIANLKAQKANHQQIQVLEHALARSSSELIQIKQKLYTSTAPSQTSGHSIKVLARIRPSNNREPQQTLTVQGNSISVKIPIRGRSGQNQDRLFTLNRVFGVQSNHLEVFQEISDSLDSVVRGGKVCIVAYGQTGSGKTFTMNSLVRYSIEYLSKLTQRMTVEVTLNCIEVYNEMTRNLLLPESFSKHWKQVLSKSEIALPQNWLEKANQFIKQACRSRITKATQSNPHSSRSHSIYTFQMKLSHAVGQVQFVDLAGSQRIKKSNTKGDLLQETLLINKSLSALQDVIASLESKQAHIPFRNSLLTQLLQPTLGSDSIVTVILNCRDSQKYAQQTICTLALGNRLKAVDLTSNLKKQLSTQEVERTLGLLEKERQQKHGLLRQLQRLQRDQESLVHSLKEKDNKLKQVHVRTIKIEKEQSDQLERIKKDISFLNCRYEDVDKKFRSAQNSMEREKKYKEKAKIQLKSKETQMKRVLSGSPVPKSPKAPEVLLTPTRIPKPKMFALNIEIPKFF